MENHFFLPCAFGWLEVELSLQPLRQWGHRHRIDWLRPLQIWKLEKTSLFKKNRFKLAVGATKETFKNACANTREREKETLKCSNFWIFEFFFLLDCAILNEGMDHMFSHHHQMARKRIANDIKIGTFRDNKPCWGVLGSTTGLPLTKNRPCSMISHSRLVPIAALPAGRMTWV